MVLSLWQRIQSPLESYLAVCFPLRFPFFCDYTTGKKRLQGILQTPIMLFQFACHWRSLYRSLIFSTVRLASAECLIPTLSRAVSGCSLTAYISSCSSLTGTRSQPRRKRQASYSILSCMHDSLVWRRQIAWHNTTSALLPPAPVTYTWTNYE